MTQLIERVWNNLPTNKQTLIEALDKASKDVEYEMRNNPQHTIQYYNALYSLLNKVILEISSRNIFDAPKDWFYSFVISNKSATLYIKHVAGFQKNEDGNVKLEINEKFRLINYPVKLLTVEEYAAAQKTEAVTVRQWIRRGKLRNAIKIGGEWRIPEISDPPARGFTPVTYYNRKNYLPLPKEFGVAFNQFPNIIYICKQEKEKGYAVLFDSAPALIPQRLLSDAEREKLELFLISNPNITNSSSIVGMWPQVEEDDDVVPIKRSGNMKFPEGWDENMF